MIDTVHIKFRITLPRKELMMHWRRYTRQRDDRSVKEWFEYDTWHDGVWIRLKYFPIDYTGNPLLCIEISSLPKIVFGNNYMMLDDIDRAISIVNEVLTQIPGLTGLDIGEAVLITIDFCYNYQVGDHVMDFHEAIGQLNYPRRERCPYSNRNGRKRRDRRNNGIMFSSKQVVTKFYDKHRQCGDPNAFGLLRHEVSIKDQSRIREILGTPSPTLRDVTPTIVKSVLQKDLEVLGLDNGIITNQTEALNILQNTYGKQIGYKLMEFLQFLHGNTCMSKPELAAKRGVKPRTINRWLKDIRNAGLVPAIPTSNITLPPLKINMEEG